MKLVEFPEQTIVIAKDQEEYLPMPAHVDIAGVVTVCWEASWRERLGVLLRGKVWHQIMTGGGHVQPVRVAARKPVLGISRGFK